MHLENDDDLIDTKKKRKYESSGEEIIKAKIFNS
jgi:hypothetical protein